MSLRAIIVLIGVLLAAGALWLTSGKSRPERFEAAVAFDIDTLARKHHLGIGLHNFGPGVAHIRSVTYYLDRDRIEDISDALEREGLDADRDTGVDLDHGDLVPPNDVIWLIDYSARSRAEELKVTDLMEHRIAIAVEYCDAQDECARLCSEADGCPAQSPGSTSAPKSEI
ncbi:MAG: hypothetical protein JO299_13100 [Gammaproteobacteria bacterium]|nr:hypothetical protein [Gammaproteobacteria bacterium]